MPKELSPEIIKDIIQNLDCGMKCYYHKKTGEPECFPDENCMPGFDKGDWEDIMKKVEKDSRNYIAFFPMNSFEGFRLRQDFIEQIQEISIRRSGMEYMSKRKPFQQFNIFLSDHTDYRENGLHIKTSIMRHT